MSEPVDLQADPLLLPFLQASSDEEANLALAQLISEHAEPIVQKIVGYKFRVFFTDNNRAQNDDAEDVHSETVVSLLDRLTELRGNPQLEGIRDFRSYVAVTGYRACYEHLRRKYPLRFSLKNKLRYFLRHQQGFSLWRSAEGEWLGGLSAWQAKPRVDSQRLSGLQDHFAEFAREMLPGGTAAGASLPDLLSAIFNWTKAAIELDELVGIVAEAWNIRDHTEQIDHDRHRVAPEKTHLLSGPVAEISERSLLAKLWGEIIKMSARHCAALLLNLKDDRGGSALELFLFTGVASFPEIAAAIGETEEWLATIWNQLPLEDSKIAERLGLIRQQVINLRKTARIRLAKYLSDTGA